MRILILDDSVRHRRAGKRQLEELGHEVVAMSSYFEAEELVGKEAFDAALIDLLMPAEGKTLGADAAKEYLGREEGVGFPVAIQLAKLGVKMVAVATDTNHHHHPMSAIVDWFGFSRPTVINGAKVVFAHSPLNEDGTKDWAEVLRRLIEA